MRYLVPLALFLVAQCYAQIETCKSFQRGLDSIVASKSQADIDTAITNMMSPDVNARCFLMGVMGTQGLFQRAVAAIEGSRTDKQTGAGAGASGSTSAIAQGAVAKTLSVAAESGALTQSVSGQVITVQGNLAGIPSALARKDVIPYCVGNEKLSEFCVRGSMLSMLRRLSFSASFDASRDSQSLTGTATSSAGNGSAQQVAFTGNKREVTAFSARLDLWNKRDEASPKYLAAWQAQVTTAMNLASGTLNSTADAFVVKLKEQTWFSSWQDQAKAKLRQNALDRAKLEATLQEVITDLRKQVGSTLDDVIGPAYNAYNNYFLDQSDLIDSLATSNIVSLVYTDSRPLGEAPVNNLKLIWDQPLTPKAKLTFNGGFDFYGATPQSPELSLSRFRDAQLGAELDVGLVGSSSITGPVTLSFAGYYQYQHSAMLLEVNGANPLPGITFTGLPANAGTVFATTGNIWLAQARISIAPPQKSVKFPISLTYSNRTELINKPEWRGQVGVSYDFDSLLSIVSPKSGQ